MTFSDPRLEGDVIAILKRVSRRPIDPTTASDLALDLGFDSLTVFEFVAELEDQFDVSIPLNDVDTIRTVGDVVQYLRDLIAEQASAR